MKGLLFSPIRLEAAALKCTLEAIEQIKLYGHTFECAFYDDNVDSSSKRLLRDFVSRNRNWRVLPPIPDMPVSSHRRDIAVRGWTADTVERVIIIKNEGLRVAKEEEFDWIFFLDADLIVHPMLLQTLVDSQHDIVAGVFWTEFNLGDPLLPNCWDVHNYKFRSVDSILRLRFPGSFEVGGLGAATLVRRRAICAGINFRRIESLDMWGEDRHFCVRAQCLGFKLYVETKYPLFHIYRPELLAAGREWVNRGFDVDAIRCRLDEKWEESVRRWFRRRMGSGNRLRNAVRRMLRATGSWVSG